MIKQALLLQDCNMEVIIGSHSADSNLLESRYGL